MARRFFLVLLGLIVTGVSVGVSARTTTGAVGGKLLPPSDNVQTSYMAPSAPTDSYPAVILADNPISYWRLNDTSTIARDQKGINDGIVEGGVLLGQPGVGPNDSSMTFQGGDIFLGTPNSLQPQYFSVEAWFKSSGVSEGGLLWRVHAFGMAVALNPSGSVGGDVYLSSTERGGATSTQGLDNNFWHHIVFSHNASTVYLYIDGQLVQQNAAQGPTYYNAYDGVAIASDSRNGHYYYGSLQDVAFYGYALTPSQVANHYAAAPSSGGYVMRTTLDCTSGCSGTRHHTYSIAAAPGSNFDPVNGGNFSGTGSQDDDPSVKENITGTLSPSGNLTFHSVYTGANPGYTYDGTATRNGTGTTFTGTAYSSTGQQFNLTVTIGRVSGVGGPPAPPPPLVLLPFRSGGYHWTTGGHGLLSPQHDSPGFQDPAFNDTGSNPGFRSDGQAPFGSAVIPAPLGKCPLDQGDTRPITRWPVDTDLLLRKAVKVPAGVRQIVVSVSVDNDMQVFWNGTSVGFAHTDQCASSNYAQFSVPDNMVKNGDNILAVRAIDRGGESYTDVSVLGNCPGRNCFAGRPVPQTKPTSNQAVDFHGHDSTTSTFSFSPPPGSSNYGVVRINFFISPPTLCGGPFCGHGDGRGFNEYAHATQNRVTVNIDFDHGNGTITANPTCDLSGECHNALPMVRWDCDWDNNSCKDPPDVLRSRTNWFIGGIVNGKTLYLKMSFRNAWVTQGPTIDDELRLTPQQPQSGDSHGIVDVVGQGDAFPSVEMYEEYGDGTTRTLGQWREAKSPNCLIASFPPRDYSNKVDVDHSCPAGDLTNTIFSGKDVGQAAIISTGLARATFSSGWPGSDVVMSLMSPSGRRIDRNTQSGDVAHRLGSTYEMYTVLDPEPGKWMVHLYGAQVAAAGEKVDLEVNQAPALGSYFKETGLSLFGAFWNYWQGHGGLAQQGFPISDELTEVSDLNGKPYTMQYLERAVFERHPENQPPYDVLLSQLGTFQYKKKYPQGATNQRPNQTEGHYFPETKHWVGGKFWQYWQDHGGLAQQGYPISDEFTEVSDLNGKPYTVQYFERAVFEYHPENAGTPYEVLLSQLGTFRYKAKYQNGGTGDQPQPTPSAPPLPANTPVAQPLRGRIAFASDRNGNGNFEIYVMNADGSQQTRLTNDPAYDGQPTWSPDGQRIAWTSGRKGGRQIYVMNPDGSQQTLISNSTYQDDQPTWSPDGQHIAFTRQLNGKGDIFVMNIDGRQQTNLTNSPSDESHSAWSPDGRRIAFTSNRDGNYEIYATNADGTQLTRLTNNPAQDDAPAWSPDGKHIAFASKRDGNSEIYVMNTDGSQQMRLTNKGGSEANPTWSPDGQHILFASYRDGNYELYVMNPDGSQQTRITNNPAYDSDPAWWAPK